MSRPLRRIDGAAFGRPDVWVDRLKDGHGYVSVIRLKRDVTKFVQTRRTYRWRKSVAGENTALDHLAVALHHFPR